MSDNPQPLEEQLAAAQARIAELEEENAQLQAQVALGGDNQHGDVTPGLLHYEAESRRAEIQGWERDTGLSYYEATGEQVEGARAPGSETSEEITLERRRQPPLEVQ